MADFLDGIKSDELTVDVVTELLESLGNLDGVDRTAALKFSYRLLL